MTHPLGIPNISIEDHEKYSDMKDWAEQQNFKTAQQEREEYMLKVLTRKPYRNGLYGKSFYPDRGYRNGQ